MVRFINTSLLEYGGTGARDVITQAVFDGDVGDVYVGAYGIMNRVVLLFVMVVLGLNQGMQPIVGYNYGARQYDRVIKTLRYTHTPPPAAPPPAARSRPAPPAPGGRGGGIRRRREGGGRQAEGGGGGGGAGAWGGGPPGWGVRRAGGAFLQKIGRPPRPYSCR